MAVFRKLFLLPLCVRVCTCVCVCILMCVCIEVCPSHATKKKSISAARAAVEPPYFALRPPLPASKAVLSSCSLVVICALISRGKFKPELDFQAGNISYFHFRAGTARTTHFISSLTFLVRTCLCVCVLVYACIEVCPSHATETSSI